MSKLRHVNTTDIPAAIRLGCRTMGSVFNADDGDIPFFSSRVRPDAFLAFSSFHSESHVPGRHLNALLNAEDAAGIRLDEDCIDKHARAAFFSYGGPLPLPLNRAAPGGALVNFIPHNVREGFHALYSLAAMRGSERAIDLAAASIAAIFEYWDAEKGWDCARLQGKPGLDVRRSGFISGLGRAIGPLVKLYRTTGLESALELALVLKEKALEYFREDGGYDPESFGTHTHSTTCVMSSLAQMADLTGDGSLLERVRAFYDKGLWEIRDQLGWVVEDSGDSSNPDKGEANNSGDIVETALILGRWGYPEYYQDAERILRGHLLPSQLRDTAFIEDPPNPRGEDGRRDVAQRHLGAYGFPAPYGHQPAGLESLSFNMDIVGGAVGSLCAAYGEVARSDEAGHWANLFFDHETEDLEIESPYTHPALGIRVKRPGPLFVRLPAWADPQQVEVEGTAEKPRQTGGYLFISRPPLNRTLTFDFPLAGEELVLEHRTRSIRVRMRGDAVVCMDNFGADLTFFDPLD